MVFELFCDIYEKTFGLTLYWCAVFKDRFPENKF